MSAKIMLEHYLLKSEIKEETMYMKLKQCKYGVKGMMAKGSELRMEIVPSWSQEEKEASAIKIRVFRGKKNVFKDDIFVSNSDIERLKKFIKQNFAR
jgi:hypothetical protein